MADAGWRTGVCQSLTRETGDRAIRRGRRREGPAAVGPPVVRPHRYHDTVTPPRPNLFDFATSELSQDAVLCWCLAWADRRYAATDPALHATARDLVASMFRAASAEAPTDEYSLELKRQFKHVDIVAELDAEHLLVIEDKVHTAEHSDQLKTYATVLASEYAARKRVFIFLKTGDQCSYTGVKADGWTTFLRKDLLDVLRRHHECTNAIFRDFLDTMEAREAAVQRFRTAPVAEWTDGDAAYVGLYMALQEHIEGAGWKYVPNKSGGFLGFTWNFSMIRGGEIYLQLEETSLVAKIWARNADRRVALRETWSRRVLENVVGFVRPQRFGRPAAVARGRRTRGSRPPTSLGCWFGRWQALRPTIMSKASQFNKRDIVPLAPQFGLSAY